MSTAAARTRAANATIDWAHDTLSLGYAAIAGAIGAHRRSLARWRAGDSVPSLRNRQAMEKLRTLRFLIESVFEEPASATEWLHSSVPMLRGRSPISFLEEGRLDEVIGVLAVFESGAAV